MIQHIVFDFGGVILDLDGVHTGYPDNLAVIFNVPVADAVKIWSENKTAVITGKETPKEFLARIKKEYDFNFDLEEGINYWEEQNIIDKSRIDWDLLDLIEVLKSNYQIHMLTDQIQLQNGASAWIDKVDTRFHTILRSYEQGFRKPFPESYHNMLQKINAAQNPTSVVFIDDNEANIDASNEIGIHSILYTFKDHDLLKNKFQELGI
ncbi:MAG: HAD-IA family hydrolase [Patescibacteria group bacterium]